MNSSWNGCTTRWFWLSRNKARRRVKSIRIWSTHRPMESRSIGTRSWSTITGTTIRRWTKSWSKTRSIASKRATTAEWMGTMIQIGAVWFQAAQVKNQCKFSTRSSTNWNRRRVSNRAWNKRRTAREITLYQSWRGNRRMRPNLRPSTVIY